MEEFETPVEEVAADETGPGESWVGFGEGNEVFAEGRFVAVQGDEVLS